MKKLVLFVAFALSLSASSQSQLQTGFCGYTVKSFGEIIYADAVPGVNQYRFQFINSATSYTQVWTNPGVYNATALYAVPGVSLGLTYSVSVATSTDSGASWSGYGTPCNLTAPGDYTTSITSIFQGSTPAWLQYIDAYPAGDNTVQYEFRLRNTALSYTQVVGPKLNENINFAAYTGLQYNTTYTIDVRNDYNGIWQAYGPSYTITTPAGVTTSISSNYCGTTAAGWNNAFSCGPVTGATKYAFKLENVALSYVQTFTYTNYFFSFSSYTGLQPSTSYSVSVSVEYNGSFGPFGASCAITTPVGTTSINPGDCGYVANNWYNQFAAGVIPGATHYAFRLQNAGLSFDQSYTLTTATFNFDAFNGLQASTPYTITVAAGFSGTFGAYGPACSITTPALPTTSMESQYCSITPASFGDYLNAVEQIGSHYVFKLENVSLGYSQTYTNTVRAFNLNNFVGLQTSTPYTVSVSMFYKGQQGAYGVPCVITTNGTGLRVSAPYPNPFNGTINIDAEQVEIIDAYGNVKYKGAGGSLGTDLDKGIYYLRSKDQNVKIIKQ